MQYGVNKKSQIFDSLSVTDRQFTKFLNSCFFSKDGHNSVLVDGGVYAVSNEPSKNRIYI